MIGDLRSDLIAAFPATRITPETIHAPDARWERYEERDALELIAGKTWLELSPEVLERHDALLIHTGSVLYRAILPAYLLFLAERELATIVAFHVLSQLTRQDNSVDRKLFPARVDPTTTGQRAVVRSAIELLAKQRLLHECASDALRSW